MTSSFCVEALEAALARFGPSEIFNTDQGSQFTSQAFPDMLKAAGVVISMDGCERWIDNVFIERLWRTLKYEEIYFRAYETVADTSAGIGQYLAFYHSTRTHQRLGRRTLVEVYFQSSGLKKAADTPTTDGYHLTFPIRCPTKPDHLSPGRKTVPGADWGGCCASARGGMVEVGRS